MVVKKKAAKVEAVVLDEEKLNKLIGRKVTHVFADTKMHENTTVMKHLSFCSISLYQWSR